VIPGPRSDTPEQRRHAKKANSGKSTPPPADGQDGGVIQRRMYLVKAMTSARTSAAR
jgi:hypothetical protein